jgi:hypothetical protein
MTEKYSIAQESASSSGSVLGDIFNIMERTSNAASHARTTSLVDATSSARVEPIVIVDQDCLYLDYLPEVLQSTQSIFVGYWLQALSMITNVGNVTVGRVLDKLNPNRKADSGAFFMGMMKGLAAENHTLSLEAYKWKLPTVALERKEAELDTFTSNANFETKSIAELSNLSIGKMINVTIRSNGEEVVIPISFRLLVNSLPSSSIVQILSTGTADVSFKERYFKWRAGRISFIKDLILCQDLIREQKKALITDKEGVYSEIMRRAKNSKLASLFTKNPSMAEASNIVIMSESTANQLRIKNNLNIDNFKDRQKIFDKTYAMIIVHIDRNYERINFYHYGIQGSTSVGLRDIKISNKNSGPDLMDILSAYKKGDAPTF